MVNYGNGKIYAIRSHQSPLIYIGSTCNPLCKRMVEHRSKYKLYQQNKCNSMTSFEILKFSDAYIELIENFNCNSKEELQKREGEIIRETENCANKRVEGRTKDQYRHDNIEYFHEINRQYHIKNREKRIQYQKDYRRNNVQKIKTERQLRYIKNKNDIVRKGKTPIHCICGSKIQKRDRAKHEKTNKHKSHPSVIFTNLMTQYDDETSKLNELNENINRLWIQGDRLTQL